MKPEVLRQARFQHGAAVTAVAASRDGQTIVSAGADGRIRIWDRATGFVRRVISAHRCSITCLALSPCQRYLVSGDEHGYGCVSELETGKSDLRRIFDSARGWPVVSVAVAASGEVVFSAGSYFQIDCTYGDRDDPAQLLAFASVAELRTSAPGRILESFEDRSARPRVRFEGDELRVELSAPPPIPALTPEGETATPPTRCVRVDDEGDVTAWPNDEAPLPAEAFAFALTADGVLIGTKSGVLSLGGQRFDEIHPEGIRALAVHGRYAITGGIDGHVRTWDLVTRKLVTISMEDAPTAIHGIATTDRLIATGDREGGLTIRNLPYLEAPRRFSSVVKNWWGFGAIAMRQNSIAFASLTEVALWRDGEVTERIKADFAVTALGFRSDGALVIVETNVETKLRVLAEGTRQISCTFEGQASCVDIRGDIAAIGFTDGSLVRVNLAN